MTNEQITKLALANGFKLKEQPDGSMALNTYVFDFARALIEEAQTATAVPDGWKLVPQDATNEMLIAMWKALGYAKGRDCKRAYRALFSAAPKPEGKA